MSCPLVQAVEAPGDPVQSRVGQGTLRLFSPCRVYITIHAYVDVYTAIDSDIDCVDIHGHVIIM